MVVSSDDGGGVKGGAFDGGVEVQVFLPQGFALVGHQGLSTTGDTDPVPSRESALGRVDQGSRWCCR